MLISIAISRNRTPSVHVGNGWYLYFSGLSLRRTSQTLSSHFAKQNRVSIRNWTQKHKPRRLSSRKKGWGGVGGYGDIIWYWFRVCMALMGGNRGACQQGNSRNKNIHGKKHVCGCRVFSIRVFRRTWEHPLSTDGGHGTHKHADS